MPPLEPLFGRAVAMHDYPHLYKLGRAMAAIALLTLIGFHRPVEASELKAADVAAAVEQSVRDAGPAVLLTSTLVVTGFALLMASLRETGSQLAQHSAQ